MRWTRPCPQSPLNSFDHGLPCPALLSTTAADPNSGGSSFSVLLGPAPHLNMAYTVFGEVTQGLEMLSKLEEVRGWAVAAAVDRDPACVFLVCVRMRLHVYCPKAHTPRSPIPSLPSCPVLQLPTRREGIFVMPLDRITILSTYMYARPPARLPAGVQYPCRAEPCHVVPLPALQPTSPGLPCPWLLPCPALQVHCRLHPRRQHGRWWRAPAMQRGAGCAAGAF